MKIAIWLLVCLLLLAHQDYWQWNDARLVLGFLPTHLAYHVGLSLATALVWLLATHYCWPAELPEEASGEKRP